MDKKIAVIYKSKYGTTKRYAEWIAEALNGTLMEASAVKPESLAAYDAVVYGGWLFAGNISGVKLVTQNPCKNLVVFSVGLADPALMDFSAVVQKCIPADRSATTKVFHLRGGVDYTRLGFIQKSMLSMVKNSVEKKPEAERSPEDSAILETYGKQADFTSKEAVEPLVAYVQSIVQ